jgi:hypothetical protein
MLTLSVELIEQGNGDIDQPPAIRVRRGLFSVSARCFAIERQVVLDGDFRPFENELEFARPVRARRLG